MADHKNKIIKKYTPPGEEEISSMMDFSTIEEGLATAQGAVLSTASVLKVLLGLGVIGLTFTYLIYTNRIEETITDEPLEVVKKAEQTVDQQTLLEKITPDRQKTVVKENAQKTGLKTQKPNEKIAKALKPIKSEKKQTKQPKVVKKEAEQPVVISNRFTDAEPLIGFDSLYKYLKESLIYPVEAPTDTIEGIVELQFTVDSGGKIINPMVITSLGGPFDKEAIRVISEMPEWRPAMVNETPLPTKKQIAIQFKKKN